LKGELFIPQEKDFFPERKRLSSLQGRGFSQSKNKKGRDVLPCKEGLLPPHRDEILFPAGKFFFIGGKRFISLQGEDFFPAGKTIYRTGQARKQAEWWGQA
jgi:hypothetical protein